MSPRRRVLVVSYHFPPAPGVASMRLRNLVRHLPAHGWDVDVVAGPVGPSPDETLAAGLDGANVVRVDTGRRPRLQRAEWAAAALRPARRLACGADAVLVSGGPFAPFALGPLLRRPYVLDFRDPWSWEPRFGRLDRRARRRLGLALERRCEAVVVRRAASVVAASPSVTEEYRRLYPRLDGRIETLRHGWEPEDFEGPPPPALEAPELVYAGTFAVGDRTPELVLAAARLVRERGTPLRVRLLGALPAALRPQTASAESEGWLELGGTVPHREAVSALRRASVLWLQLDDEVPFLVSGKVYECLAAGPPIVAAAPGDGALAEVLGETGGAIVTPSTPSGCADALLTALDGRVPPRREDAVAGLATPLLGERLAAILERAAR